jgi:hypothetical protein
MPIAIALVIPIPISSISSERQWPPGIIQFRAEYNDSVPEPPGSMKLEEMQTRTLCGIPPGGVVESVFWQECSVVAAGTV